MSASGLPILISRNCVRASQTASRCLSKKETICLDHTRSAQFQRKSSGAVFSSRNCNMLCRSFTTGAIQYTVRHINGHRAIKLSNFSHKSTSKRCSASSSTSATILSSSTKRQHLPAFHSKHVECRVLFRVPVGSRCLSSKNPSTTPPNDSNVESTKEEPAIVKPSEIKGTTSPPPSDDSLQASKEEPILVKKESSKQEPMLLKAAKKVAGKVPVAVKVPDTDMMMQVPEVTKTEEKPYRLRRKKVDYTKKFVDNVTITKMRAMLDYALKPSDLKNLRHINRRTPYNTDVNEPSLQLYLRRDVEEKALEVHGSKEALQRAKEKTKRKKDKYKESDAFYVKDSETMDALPKDKERPPSGFFARRDGHVVFSAICINTANFMCKLVAWVFSGSSSMFSEAIHSLADTLNQCILAWGIYSGSKEANKDHPYGYANMPYVSSLISGVAIFCVGSGLSFYHGIMGLLHPEPLESLFLSYCILAGALASEGATLLIAIDAIKKEALAKNISFFQYVWRSRNPSVNVVLLEDSAAVLGVAVAAGCMGMTSMTGNPMYDAIGSIAIGGILASVSGFLVYTNAQSLIWRSIPENELTKIAEMMVNDPVVRGVHDVKATVMGVGHDRFKAEIDFDGREVTRAYLDTQDLDTLLTTLKNIKTPEELETFMLVHGEKLVDLLGFHIDRIEKDIKKLNLEIRHVDLEVL